jgi:pimeloyl-ACP methyl ester carboxylesterase
MRLHFQSHGAGFPLIILHGLLGSLDNWHTISQALGESFQVFAVDQRNHGRSPHSDVFDYAAMADDLLEFMETHHLARAHVLGHSLGGKTAMHFALNHPALVERLVVVDMAPRAYPPEHLPLLDALLALDLRSFRGRNEAGNALAPAVPGAAMRQFLLKNLARDGHGAWHWKINLPAIKRNYPALNAGIGPGRSFAGPVLFIKAGRSDYLGDADVPLIHQLFPRTTIKTVPGAGHWMHAEAPDKLLKMTLNFLRKEIGSG